MEQHLNYILTKSNTILQNSNHLTIPTLFEYYTSYFLSQKFNKCFYVWNDITPEEKSKHNFPITDKGCDVTDVNFDHLCQCKYYENSRINFGKLSTFLAFDKFSGRSHDFCLVKSENSTISNDIKSMIKMKTIQDITLTNDLFQDFIELSKSVKNIETVEEVEEVEEIEKEQIQIEEMDEIEQEQFQIDEIDSNTYQIVNLESKTNQSKNFVLRPPQIEGINLINKSNRNVKIQLPTGLGKTLMILEYIKSNSEGIYLVLVPTIILLEQWYDEATKYGICKILRIGTGYSENYKPGKYNLIICVFNSYEIIRQNIHDFKKIVIDEAHHIYPARIYKHNLAEKNKSYLNQIMSDISDSTKTVMISATLDKTEDCDYYSYPIREAIENNYISDYQIILPIFSSDPSDENIVEYLIKRESHCIVYTTTIEKCKEIENIFNKLLPGCCKSIHSKKTKTDRKNILGDFENDKIKFLVNVRVLVEGFNSTKASSCVFLHIPSNDIFVIQCLGRILRKHQSKRIANLYLPFNKEDDIRYLPAFLKFLCKNDTKIGKCINNKTLGTYLNIQRVSNYENKDDNFAEFLYDKVFNSVEMFRFTSSKEFRIMEIEKYVLGHKGEYPKKTASLYGTDEYRVAKYAYNFRILYDNDKLEKMYIDLLDKIPGWKWGLKAYSCKPFEQTYIELSEWIEGGNDMPSSGKGDENLRRLGRFVERQRELKRKGKLSLEKIHKLDKIKGWDWKEDRIVTKKEFNENLEELKAFVEKNNRLPSVMNKEERRLGLVCVHFKQSHKKGTLSKDKFEQLDNIKGWLWYTRSAVHSSTNITFKDLEDWFKDKGKLPSYKPTEEYEIKLRNFIAKCMRKHKNNNLDPHEANFLFRNGMKCFGEPRKTSENDFGNTFEKDFDRTKKWIGKNNRIPSIRSKDIEEKEIGQFRNRMKRILKANKLSEDKIEKLSTIKYFEDFKK